MASHFFTLEEVATRSLVAIANVVYDVSAFITEHPGGDEVLREAMGTDATAKMMAAHMHSEGARRIMEKFRVGTLVAAPGSSAASEGAAISGRELLRAPSAPSLKPYGRLASAVTSEGGGAKVSIQLDDEECAGEELADSDGLHAAATDMGAAGGAGAGAISAPPISASSTAAAVSKPPPLARAPSAICDPESLAARLREIGFADRRIEAALADQSVRSVSSAFAYFLKHHIVFAERPGPAPAAAVADGPGADLAGAGADGPGAAAAAAAGADAGASAVPAAEPTASALGADSALAVASAALGPSPSAEAEALRERYLLDVFLSLGYKRRYVERALADTHGRGVHAVLDWFKALWQPLDSRMFRYREVAPRGLRAEVCDMTSRLRELRASHREALSAAGAAPSVRAAAGGMSHLTADEASTVAAGGVRHVIEQAFAFPIFNAGFGHALIAEIDRYLACFQRAGMGFQMDEFGWLGVIKQMLTEHLVPIVTTLLPQYKDVVRFRDVYSKIVKYTAKPDAAEDRDWPVHIDESDVTINLCLGSDFVGSGLQFVTGIGPDGAPLPGTEIGLHPYTHVPGTCIFHPGTLAHGVGWLRSGSRYSIIILLNEPELADGSMVRIPKPELAPASWERLVELQEEELQAAQAAAAAEAATAVRSVGESC